MPKVTVDELQKSAYNWFSLGIYLTVLLAKQQLTKHGYQQIDECRKEPYLAWNDREFVRTVFDKGKTPVYGKFCCVFTFISASKSKGLHYLFVS